MGKTLKDLPHKEPEAIANIRKRPGMYVGDTRDGSGLHQLVWEVVGNAVDEYLAGYCHRIAVTLHEDGSVTVEDDGRGIPVELHSSGQPILEVVLTQHHTSGTFDGHTKHVHLVDRGAGLVVTNALSRWLIAEVARGGKLYRQEFQSGIPKGALAVVREAMTTGTRISFAPDPAIFPRCEIDGVLLRERLREIAFLSPDLSVRFVDAHSEIVYPEGIVDFAVHLAKGEATLPARPFHVRGGTDAIGVEAALCFRPGSEGPLRSFVNLSETREGGTHVAGVQRAVAALLGDERYLGRAKVARVLHGWAIGVIAVTHHAPTLGAPTQARLMNPEVQPVVEAVVREGILALARNHPEEVRELVEAARRDAQ